MKLPSTILLILALVLEASVTTLPVVFVTLLCLAVVYQDTFVFIQAFIFGLLLDAMTFRPIGASSTFFTVFVFLVTLYQHKFEIATYYFILVSAFLGSLGYLLLLGYNDSIFLQSILSCLIGLFLFIILKRVGRQI